MIGSKNFILKNDVINAQIFYRWYTCFTGISLMLSLLHRNFRTAVPGSHGFL